ncbi:MAG: GNAT family N-acetyltransferase [Haloferacaceae archaeon]
MTGLLPEVVVTPRLRLEPRVPANVDVYELYDVCAADGGEAMSEVTAYLPWSPHETIKETRDFLERGREMWEEDGDKADYVIRPREGEDGAGEIAGFGGLTIAWDRKSAELGIWLRKPFWGRGYSGERAIALSTLAFDRLGLEVVQVTVHRDNEKSRRAVEKYVARMGGRYDGLFRNRMVLGDDVADEHHFSVSAEEWEEADVDLDVRFE